MCCPPFTNRSCRTMNIRPGIAVPSLVALLAAQPASAQLNESDTSRFQLRVESTGAWQQGNVELLLLRSRAEIVTDSRHPLVFKSQNSHLYQEFGGRAADNDVSSRNFLYWNPGQALYPFAIMYVQTNLRRRVEYRVFGGAGATWQAIRSTSATVKLSAGLVFEDTRFSSSAFNSQVYDGSRHIALWRSTLYVAGWHRVFSDKLHISYIGYWQGGITHVPNHRVHCEAGIELPVLGGLHARAAYLFSYDQVVAQRVRQVDGLLTFGFSYHVK